MPIILGLNPGLLYEGRVSLGSHDISACLLKNGELVAAVEEERFSRNKWGTGDTAERSIKFVLERSEISVSDVDIIAIGWDPKNFTKRMSPPTSLNDMITTRGKSISQGFDLRLINDLIEYAGLKTGIREKSLKQDVTELVNNATNQTFDGEVLFIPHHLSHAASARYTSDFNNQLVITADGGGEHNCTVVWSNNLEKKMEFKLPNSIGHFYAAGAEYLGYTKPSGKRHAGKVMGLAPYGEFREEYSRLFDDLVDIQQGKYDVTDFRLMDVESLESLFGKRHSFPEEFEDRHKDFAYHLQNKTEQIIKHLVEYWINSTNTTNLSVAGGVFMNCKLNREISKMDCVDNLYIQPASNDSGIAIGAALEAHKIITSKSPEIHLNNLYLGPEYSGDQIETVLKTNKIQYEKCDDISKTTAKLLADDNLVGWFQGRLEFGARALGNRSILANPTSEESLEKVNSKVKNREGWRPFAPSILYESRKEYFRSGDEMPFMINTDIVKHNKQDKVPAIVHTDGSARPQTVRENSNPRYHRLLSEFERLTDVPMLLNTSFNISGEPIVESPNQAIQDFYTTALDVLVLEDYLITK